MTEVRKFEEIDEGRNHAKAVSGFGPGQSREMPLFLYIYIYIFFFFGVIQVKQALGC